MVEAIAPVVHGDRKSFRIAAAAHVLGAATSGGLLGMVLGALGAVAGAPWGPAGFLGIAVVAAVYLTREALEAPVPLLQARRQVPEWWQTFFSRPVAALLYGVGLGVGFLTYLSYGTFIAVALAAVVYGDPVIGGLLCAAFGLARGVATTWAARNGTTVEQNAAALDKLAELGSTSSVRWLNAAALLGVLVAASATAL